MRHFIVTTVALLMATTAYAGDLPSKATPAAPADYSATPAVSLHAHLHLLLLLQLLELNLLVLTNCTKKWNLKIKLVRFLLT